MLFPYNVGERKKIIPGWATVSVEFTSSPHVYEGFLQVLWCPATSPDVHVG